MASADLMAVGEDHDPQPLQRVGQHQRLPVQLFAAAQVRRWLPIGVLVTARYGDDATLFRLAAQLEAAQPWADRWPEIETR
jgi:Asp-tRNA(Asn)/Glu-tRNA(Gln) amidotransferase A subunit family amidase